MNEQPQKDNRKALIGTIIFHGVVIVLLFFFGLSTPLPLPEEEGVIVALGFTDVGDGNLLPLAPRPALPAPAPQPVTRTNEEVVTQDTEESIALPPAQPRPRPRQETQTRPEPQPATPQPQPVTEQPRQQVDQRALFPGADQRTATTPSQGTTGQTGAQGRPEGATGGTGTGLGQEGVSFDLAGRRPNILPMPEYDVQAQGRVVVAITVDRQGRVIRATAGARGTQTTDATLFRLAEDAARRSRFDVKLDAPEEQIGTITYFFIRQN
ncbi:MAG TPA: hypothetical protein VLH61_02015 [Bacteroidales bacterium]|nr:hypothetical protein [Bacteroidales bacterium]